MTVFLFIFITLWVNLISLYDKDILKVFIITTFLYWKGTSLANISYDINGLFIYICFSNFISYTIKLNIIGINLIYQNETSLGMISGGFICIYYIFLENPYSK